MRIVFFFLLFGLVISNYSQEQEEGCEIFRKGKFTMTGPAGGDIKIKRKKKHQYERYNRERQRYKFSIEWTSNCNYTLTLLRVKGKKTAKKFEGSKVFVEIIDFKRDSYTARSRTEDGKVTIIEIEKTF